VTSAVVHFDEVNVKITLAVVNNCSIFLNFAEQRKS